MGVLGAIGTIGSAGLRGTDALFSGIGKVAIGAGKIGLKASDMAVTGAAKSAAVYGAASVGPLSMIGKAAKGLGKRMVKYKPETRKWDPDKGDFVIDKEGGLKLTKLGAGVIFGAGALGSIMDGSHTVDGKNMGQSSGQVYTPTPEITPQQYNTGFVDNGGATGDLVFALHKNR